MRGAQNRTVDKSVMTKTLGGSAVLHANRRAIPLAKGSSEEEAFSLYLESTAYRLIGQRR